MQVGYVTLGTNDLERACAFYDALMGTINFSRIWDDGSLVIWNVETGEPLHSRPRGAQVEAVAWSPDGRLIAAGSTFDATLLWDPASGQEIFLSSTAQSVMARTSRISPLRRFTNPLTSP